MNTSRVMSVILFLLCLCVGVHCYAAAVNITIDRMDASTDGELWHPMIFSSTTVDIFGSDTTSVGGHSIEIQDLPAGTYKYIRLYITKLSYIEGGSEIDLTGQLCMLSDTNFNPMYFSHDGSITVDDYGISDIFYEHTFKVGKLVPFTVTDKTKLIFYFIVPAEFVVDGQLTCVPKISILPQSSSDISSSDTGTVSGSIATISSNSTSVFVGAYESFQVDVAPIFFVKATNNGDGTASYSLSLPEGEYQIVSIEDVNGDMETTIYPSGTDRLYANGSIPDGITPTTVTNGSVITENLLFSDILSNIEGYGGAVGDSVAKLYTYPYMLKGLPIDTEIAKLFLMVYPVIDNKKGDDPVRVSLGDVEALVNAAESNSQYTYTFPNMPIGMFYFYVHLDMNGNGIQDPGDFRGEPIHHGGPEEELSIVPYTVSEGGTLESPVDLNASDPITIRWANRKIPFGDASVNPVQAWGAYAVGDFNKDGNLDVATGADFTDNIHDDPDQLGIHLGKGDGTFNARVDYDTGINITSIAPGDFDKDGDTDIAAMTYEVYGDKNDDVINVHLNNGDGTFQPKVTYNNGGPLNGHSGQAIDINGDGNLDIITISGESDRPDYVHIHFGNGDGTFQPEVHYEVSDGVNSCEIADVDNDGDIDIVTASNNVGFWGVNEVNVLHNNGDGTFAPAVKYSHNYRLCDVAIADISKDGNLDVITASNGGGSLGGFLSVYLGSGDGSLQPPSYYETVDSVDSLVVDDFNGDSKPDFIAGGDGIFVHTGPGDGTVAAGVRYAPSTGGTTWNLQKHDINNDGKPDLAWAIYGVSEPGTNGNANNWVAITFGR